MVTQEGICLAVFSARLFGVEFLENRRSLKHSTDWGSFEMFSSTRKGILLWNMCRHWGVHPGVYQKLSVVLAASVLLTSYCADLTMFKVFPPYPPPTIACDVQSLLDAWEDGHAQPLALWGGGSEQPCQQQKSQKPLNRSFSCGWGSNGALE